MDNGSVWLFISICMAVQVGILGFFAWQMGNLVAAARSIEVQTSKSTVLLTVLCNKQGATQEDVAAATAK